MENNGEIKVKSLQKALEILNCFAVKQPLGVTEISEKLGLYKSNVHNILVTFTAMEYLVQDPESGKFRLGPEVMMLSRAFRENLDITKIAVPVMREIANEVQELVYLAVPKGEDMLYLEAVSPENQRLVTKSVTGECSKMYCTSVEKQFWRLCPKRTGRSIFRRNWKLLQSTRSQTGENWMRRSGWFGSVDMQWMIWKLCLV